MSDTGNDRDRTNAKSGGVVDYPSHTFNYSNGRFTNDDQTNPASHTYLGVWHEQLARSFLGIAPATYSLGGGFNYAFGGAMTTNGTHEETAVSTPFGDVTVTIDDMGKQMDDYLSAHPVADPKALYIVYGGGNDLRNDNSAANVTATANRIAALVSRLANAGAKYIMVPNLPPVGDIPRYSGNASTVTTLNVDSLSFRSQLNADLATLQSNLASQGISFTLVPVDVWANTMRIFSDPARYGLTNITDPAQGTSGANPDQYAFWDDVHPTTSGHFQIAKIAYTSITNPPTSPSKAANISSRVFVNGGDGVAIGGFIITGNATKKVLIRGIGPSLASYGVPNPLPDPDLTLFDSSGKALLGNNNWKDFQASDIAATGVAPKNDLEAALLVNLGPGTYTATLFDKNNASGNGLVEIYDLNADADSTLSNISTRGFVGTGDNVLIGGFIIGNGDNPIIVVRALGPSLSNSGVSNPLPDPTLELHDSNGTLIGSNDDWKVPQLQAVRGTTLAPGDDRESAIVAPFLSSGYYTAVVRGKNNATGIAVVEVYRIQ